MKKLAIVAAVATTIFLPNSGLAQETLRFASFEPPVAFVTKNILTKWAEDVTADSGGTLNVQMFPGGTLGRDPAQQAELVENGVVDIAWIVAGYTPGRFDGTTITELPFGAESAKGASIALTKLVKAGKIDGDFDRFKVLGTFATDPAGVMSNFEVNTPEDLKGKKLRSAGPTMLKVVNALGATPIGGITAPTIAEAISRGLIDGSLNEWNAGQTFGITKTIDNYVGVPLGSNTLMVLMNKDKFESLPDEAKAAIDKHSGEAFASLFGGMVDKYVAEIAAKIKEDGKIRIVEPDADQMEEWRQAVQPAIDEWVAERENGQALLDEYRSMAKKAGAQD